MKHQLRTLYPYYQAVKNRTKKFEARLNDRNYRVGDDIELIEIDRLSRETGNRLLCKITFILPGGAFGVQEGYCVMSVEVEKEWKQTAPEILLHPMTGTEPRLFF